MMKHKKTAAILFTELTACSVFFAFSAGAEKLEVNQENYEDLDAGCVNIVAMRDDRFDPRENEGKLQYDVEL